MTAAATATISDLMLAGGRRATGDGGAIWNAGTLTLERVTVANSRSDTGSGGGILNAAGGTLNLRGVTLSGNSAQGTGGGIASAGTLTVRGSTITNNSAGSGGAGLDNQGAASLGNTLLAANSGAADAAGVLVSAGHNLIGNAEGATGLAHGVNGDQVGGLAGASPINPRIGSLGDYGGSSWTHPLLPGSPAIDAGAWALAPETDQRGAPSTLDGLDPGNPQDALPAPDIGAFEFGALFVNLPEDAVDTTPLGDGLVDARPDISGHQVSLRAAILELGALAGWNNQAQTTPGFFEGVILLGPAAQRPVLALRGANENDGLTGDLDVRGNISIRGTSPNASVIDAGGFQYSPYHPDPPLALRDRVFHVHPGARLLLEQLNVMGGHAWNDGTVDAGRGGAVFNDGGDVELVGAALGILGLPYGVNTADEAGGGVYSRAGTVTLRDRATIDGNAGNQGGGIFLASGTLARIRPMGNPEDDYDQRRRRHRLGIRRVLPGPDRRRESGRPGHDGRGRRADSQR